MYSLRQQIFLILVLLGMITISILMFLNFQQEKASNYFTSIVLTDTATEIRIEPLFDDSNLVLVPKGYDVLNQQKSEITRIFKISLSKVLIKPVQLEIEIRHLESLIDPDYQHLIQLRFSNDLTKIQLPLYNTPIEVMIYIYIIEPIDYEDHLIHGYDASRINVDDSKLAYEALIHQSITYNLIFNVLKK